MARIREQLPLLDRYAVNGKSDLRDAAAAENKSVPIHRWVPWIAGFSANFAHDVIDTYLPMQGRSRHLVLDPFAGVGTTLVEALKAGCNTVGYEINAFAALAAQVKLACVELDGQELKKHIDAFRISMKGFESRIDRVWGDGNEAALARALKTLQAARPTDFRSRVPFFGPPVEAKFLYALGYSANLPQPYRNLFRVALGATMVSVSNYTYEPSLSSRPGAGKPLIENASVVLAVARKLDEMADDVGLVEELYEARWRPRRRVVYDVSYFSSAIRQDSVSLVVTSPPYMNNYHYVRNTRPQLRWLGLVEGKEALRDYERESFGTFWQTVRQSKPVELNFRYAELQEKISRLRCLNVDRGAYGGPGWANYVATYFNDTRRFLDLLHGQLKHGGYAVVVVGNSIIQGMEFKVDQYLASLAEKSGYHVAGIEIVRTKRVGSSIVDSAIRNGGGDGRAVGLYDAAVILRVS